MVCRFERWGCAIHAIELRKNRDGHERRARMGELGGMAVTGMRGRSGGLGQAV